MRVIAFESIFDDSDIPCHGGVNILHPKMTVMLTITIERLIKGNVDIRWISKISVYSG